MRQIKKWLAMLLTMSLLAGSVESTGIAAGAARQEADGTQTAAQQETERTQEDSLEVLTEENRTVLEMLPYIPEMTWTEAGVRLCALLGLRREDAANTDMDAVAAQISGVSLEDDSFCLAILAERGYLDGLTEGVSAGDVIAQETWGQLLEHVFPTAVSTQEAAQALYFPAQEEETEAAAGEDAEKETEEGAEKDTDRSAAEDPSRNIAFAAQDRMEPLTVTSVDAARLALTDGGSLALESVKAKSLSVPVGAQVTMSGSEVERVVVGAADAGVPQDSGNTAMHLDTESKLAEMIIEHGGEVTVEGSGALGLICVRNEDAALTVRATATVLNDTEQTIAVTGPEGETAELGAGETAEFVLKGYLVTFVTEGTPVETQTVVPGGAIDFAKAQTELDGKLFTAWYTDAEYTKAYAMTDTVDGQLTLYARFIDAADAAVVTFETFGGRELEPQVFAKGETLLTKEITRLYTGREGYTFGGWCLDEECKEPFGYTEPIMGNMTLYALYTENEVLEREDPGTVAELADLDWQGAIPLLLPAGMSVEELAEHVTLEVGTGGEEPKPSFRETEDGAELYGAYYEQDGAYGFEPGATFTVHADGGVRFAGYEDYIDTLTVSVYKETVETVEFTEGLTYVLWEDTSEYVPVDGSAVNYNAQLAEDGTVEETETQTDTVPGSLLLHGQEKNLKPGQIVVFYDGEINDDEMSASAWESGSLDGYALFAKIEETKAEGDGLRVTFTYANPEEYLSKLDVHTTKEVDVEQELDDETVARIERSIRQQVSGNDELSAQMLVSVMTAQQTQDQLDEKYGAGTYSLAAVSASIQVNTPRVGVSVSGNTATASISVSATVTLENDGEALLSVTPTLSFEEALSVNVSIDGGWLWIDTSLSLMSVTTVRLTVTAASGGEEDILSDTKKALETLASMDGLDDTMDYDESVGGLMDTLNALVSSELQYNDLFAVPLMQYGVGFHGIVGMTVQVSFVGQIGILASFGMELVATSGHRIGFNYNFLKFTGGSYKEKLASGVKSEIYVVGKVGVRLGIRVEVMISMAIVKTSITGEVFAYAELSGMYLYAANLLSGDSQNLGGMKFEVGIDASITLALSVNLVLFTVNKDWTVWSERWPIYTLTKSNKFKYMDTEKLDQIWESETANADNKSSYGFAYIPMKTYTLADGSCVNNQVLWGSTVQGASKYSLSFENIKINGEAVSADDPRTAVLVAGNGAEGRTAGRVYIDEKAAASLKVEQVDCDVMLTYEDTGAAAIVKKQTHVFPLSRRIVLSTTTVDVNVVLSDWCAHSWGLVPAEWDGAEVYRTSFETSHAVGKADSATAAGQLDLAGIEAAAKAAHDLGAGILLWKDPTRNDLYGAMEYSVPMTSSFCYLVPGTGAVSYDVTPETTTYSLTFVLYVKRFEGDSPDITYVVRTLGEKEADCAFSIDSPDKLELKPSGEKEWQTTVSRAAFDGKPYPLLMSVDGGEALQTGYTVTGREPKPRVEFVIDLDSMGYTLTLHAGEGVKECSVVSPELQEGEKILPGTQVHVAVQPEDGYDHAELAVTPKSVQVKQQEKEFVFTMPQFDVEATASVHPIRTLTFDYNYKNLGVYTTAHVSVDGVTTEPQQPSVEGLTFRGWYTTPQCDGEPFAFGEPLTEDLTLYADWTCDVTVMLGGAKGEAICIRDGRAEHIFAGDTTQYERFTYSTQRVGEHPLEISLPDYSGHVFLGWYLNAKYEGDPVDPTDLVLDGGLTLYARWTRLLPITYDLNYETGEGDAIWHYGTELYGFPMRDVPAAPEREHYVFTGWYTGENCTQEQFFDTAARQPENEMTLYAGWEPAAYAITYDLQGGSDEYAPNPTEYTVETGEITLTQPQRTGYTFLGWTGSGLTEPAAEVTIPAGSFGERSYTANWKPIVYQITYNLVRGEVLGENPVEYTIESPDITLVNPQKNKYTFEGWTGTELEQQTKEVTIPAGSIGDRAYTATWSTEDASEQIADDAILAAEGEYTYELDAFVEGCDEESSIYRSVRAAIDSDENSGPYAEALGLTMTLDETAEPNPAEDAFGYTWTFTAHVTYTPDTGEALTRDGKVTAIVKKRVPQLTAPVISDLAYGNALAQCTLTGGSASYIVGDTTETVEGSFAWTDDTVVPKSADNGSEIYELTFTPEEEYRAKYAPATILVAVTTQTGVKVEITADDRYYIAGVTQTTGRYTLKDADTEEELTSLKLTGGEYHFADAQAGTAKTVIFKDYALAAADGADADMTAYALTNVQAETTADMERVPYTQMKVVLPAAEALTYGDILGDRALTGGSVKFSYDYEYHKQEDTIAGTWSWATPEDSVNAAGADQKYEIVFTPTDKGYEGGSGKLTLTVAKQAVPRPTPQTRVYNKALQTSGLTSQTTYTVKDNGGRDAGSCTAVLTLRDPANYCWSANGNGTVSGANGETLTLTYEIRKADLTKPATTASVTSLGYGQRLIAGTDGNLQTNRDRLAKYMISNYTPTFQNQGVNGSWSWQPSNLTQPLGVNQNGYTVKAVFTPEDKNLNAMTQSFTVKVDKASPDVSKVNLSANTIYKRDKIANAGLTASGNAVNPSDGSMTVAGTWEWENPGRVPNSSGEKFSVKFVPTDQTNYKPVLLDGQVAVSTRDFVNVTIKFVENGSAVNAVYNNGTPVSQIVEQITPTAEQTTYQILKDQAIMFARFDNIKKEGRGYKIIGISGTGGYTCSYDTSPGYGVETYSLKQDDFFNSQFNIVWFGEKEIGFRSKDKTHVPTGSLSRLMEYTTQDAMYKAMGYILISITESNVVGDFTITVTMKSAVFPDLTIKSAKRKAVLQTEAQTEIPTEGVTEPVTETPTGNPADAATEGVTENQTETPLTEKPTTEPSTEPSTEKPTETQTEAPTEKPTEAPAEKPTEVPTEAPTEKPTEAPTEAPTEKPTEAPTEAPTEKATEPPTEKQAEAQIEAPPEALSNAAMTEPETE